MMKKKRQNECIMNEKGILKSGNTTLEKRDSDAILGSVYQIFGLYPEIYYGMISAEIAEQQRWNKRKTKNQKQKRNYIGSFKIK